MLINSPCLVALSQVYIYIYAGVRAYVCVYIYIATRAGRLFRKNRAREFFSLSIVFFFRSSLVFALRRSHWSDARRYTYVRRAGSRSGNVAVERRRRRVICYTTRARGTSETVRT